MIVSSAKSAPLSGVKGVSPRADSITYAALAPKGTNKVPSCEARTKALCNANYLHCSAKIKAPLSAKSEATTTSLPALSSAKLALGGGAKRLASSSEANVTGVILTSPVIKKRSVNARALQLEQPSTRPPRVSVLGHLCLVNPYLREFLTNKRKFCYEKLSHTSPSCCEQAVCQLVTVHSVHYRLGSVPITPPARQ